MTRPAEGLTRRLVVIRDLDLTARVGIYPHENQKAQAIRVNIELDVETRAMRDEIADAVSYETVVNGVKARVAAGHVNLVETLAERIADDCLADVRVKRARVRVEKLSAIAEAAGVGAEVVKARGAPVPAGAGG